MTRTITVRKYFKPSLGKEVNKAGYTRKVKNAPERTKYEKPKLKNQIWDVFLSGRKIDSVSYNSDVDADYVKKSLIDHDGYNPEITVRKEKHVQTTYIQTRNKKDNSIIYKNGWTGIKDRSLAVKPEGEKHIIISRRKPFSKEEEYDTILVNVDDLKKLLRKVSR